jgi:hypothetical protein
MRRTRKSAGEERREIAGEPMWYEPADSTPREQCPCCDYVSLPERNNYLICPICFWEDDGQDIDNLDRESGPNRMTLRQGRENFKRIGACEERLLREVLTVEERKAFNYWPRAV